MRFAWLGVCAAALASHLCPKSWAQEINLVITPAPVVSTIVGGVTSTSMGTTSTSSLSLRRPDALAIDVTGSLYIADTGNNVILKRTSDGSVVRIAGDGTEGFTGDGGPATLAQLDRPAGVAVQMDGSILIADTRNHRIRKVAADGSISTIAGDGLGSFGGDSGPAKTAHMRLPSSIALGSGGSIYIADTGNHRVRLITPDGTIRTVAGSGAQGNSGDGGPATAAELDSPAGLAVDAFGEVLIADRRNDRIRVIGVDGKISTLPSGSVLRRPFGVGLSASGDVFIADTGSYRVQQVSAAVTSSVLGTGVEGPFRPGADPAITSIAAPSSVVADASGNLIVADRGHSQVQIVRLPGLDFGPIPAGQQSPPQLVTLQNAGASAFTLLGVTLPATFVQTSASTCGSFPRSLPPGTVCVLSLAFAPAAAGQQKSQMEIAVAGSPARHMLLTGTASARGSLAVSITALQTSGAIAYAGSPLAFTARVQGTTATPPTGSVDFRDNTQSVGQAIVGSDGTATYNSSALGLGTHVVQAVYSGDSLYQTSTSKGVNVRISALPDFTLALASAQNQTVAAGTVANIGFVLQPQGGPLGKPVQLSITGLPPGWGSTFTPSQFALGSDPVSITLAVTTRQVAALGSQSAVLCATALCVFLRRHRRWASAIFVSVVLLSHLGCGGGYMGNSKSGSASGLTYPLTITATTTGVTGAPLIHSLNTTLVVH